MSDISWAIDDGKLKVNKFAFLEWDKGGDDIVLDGHFTLEELEAIVAFMRENRIVEEG